MNLDLKNPEEILSLNVTLCINEPSKIIPEEIFSPQEFVINTSELFFIDINATNDSILPVLFYDNTTLFEINLTTGVINFTPPYRATTTYHVNISIDTCVCPGYEDSKVLKLHVRCKNHQPFMNIPNLTFWEETLCEGGYCGYNLTSYVNDIDGSEFVFSYDPNIFTGTSGEDNGIVYFYPDDEDIGSHIIKVTVQEISPPPPNCGGILQNHQYINVTVYNVNDAPTITPIGAQTLESGDTLIMNVTAYDPDPNEAIIFTANYPWFKINTCLLYTSPSPRDLSTSRMPSSA